MHRSFFENSLSEKLNRISLPANLAVVRVAHVHAVFVTEDILLPIREDRLSVRKFAFFSSLAVELVWVWALLNVAPVQKVFNTAHEPSTDLWILLPFPVLLFLSHEVYKWLRRRRNSSRSHQAAPAYS